MSEAKTPNNNPTKSIHQELIDAVKAEGLKQGSDFKFKQNTTGDGSTAIRTNLPVEGEKTLTVVINSKANGELVEFHKTSQGEAVTRDSLIGSTAKPSGSARTFQSLVANQELVKGLENIKTKQGNVDYKVTTHSGSVTTSVSSGNGQMDIVQTDVKLDTKKALQSVSEMVEANKPKAVETQSKKPATVGDLKQLTTERVNLTNRAIQIIQGAGEKFTASDVKELGDKISRAKLGGGVISTIGGVLLTSKVEAAVDKTPKESLKGTDNFVGSMGITGYALNEAAKVLKELGVKSPETADTAQKQHIASKPQATKSAQITP